MKKVYFSFLLASLILLTACSKSNLGEEQKVSSGKTMVVKSIEKYSNGELVVSVKTTKDSIMLAEDFDVIDDSKTHLKFKEFQEGKNTSLYNENCLVIPTSQNTGDFKVIFDLGDLKSEKFTVSYKGKTWNN
ncbi:hypothetical protein MK516_06250 [Streptococcus gallolyticus subsp. gallolyticus]|uniref:hypothetical protein n=1 Tax=Streptococcus gallolyticus TaxID=315405 RepID=UPI0022848E0D|nr:hypothetical protein [Streptococcus gallolyticus]MCY7172127.1 hypothetical protein [Streptococcus gallolyticus subsp. gallolyticus]